MSKMDISTEDLWDEVRKELLPEIPWNRAKTINEFLREINDQRDPEAPEIGENFVRKVLERKHKHDGWGRIVYKGVLYFWPPEENYK